jgi:sterol 24-C-methyltransferase
MAWPLSSPPPSNESLSRRLRKLDRVFRLDALRAEALDAPQVVAYYEQCSPAYRKHHSSEGAMHLAISEGSRFHAQGFYGQLRRIAAGWPARPPRDVLELGFGQGFNLAHLAARFPDVRFSGIDLTPAHRQLAGSRCARLGLRNVALTQGDFHDLPYQDASFDHVFSIEAFCYAKDLDRAFAGIARVLRPGGTLTLFDGYLVRRPESFSADEALAAELVAKGVALERFQGVDEILAQGRKAGLEDGGVTSFDSEILPNLRKLERLTAAVIRFPWLGRRALARRSPMRGRNVITGYLLHSTVSLGLTVYREIVLRKPA